MTSPKYPTAISPQGEVAVRGTAQESHVGEVPQDAQHSRDIEVIERCEQQVLEQAGIPPGRDIDRDRWA